MTISWKSAQSGSWNVAANWSPTQVPGNGDDALIGLSGAYLVAVGTATVQTLTLDDGDGELQVNGPLTIADTLTVNAGTLDITLSGALVAIDLVNTGTIIDDGQLNIRGHYDAASLSRIGGTTGAVALQGTLENSGGTFDGSSLARLTIFAFGSIDGGTVVGLSQPGDSNLNDVTWRAPIELDGRHVTIENGLIVTNPLGFLPGTVDLGTGGTLDFSGDQSFDHVNIGSQGTITAEDILTLGPGVSIEQTTNSTGLVVSGPGTIVNQGVISLLGSPASRLSSTQAVILVAKFQNDGTLAATSAGTIAHGLDSIFRIISPAFNNDAAGLLEAAGGAISVSTGTDFTNDGTVLVDAGTIDIAPLLSGTGVAELQSNGTLELGSAVTAGQVVDFLDSGLLILDQPVFFAGTIGHIGTSDVIRLGLSAMGVGYDAGALKMQTAGGQDFSLAIPGASALSDFMINTGGSSTTIELACFAAGTYLATERGEMRVEEVRAGELVRLAGSDGLLPVVWVGHRRVDCRRHPVPAQVWPVRIAAHAFARNVPGRELRLSPDHAVLVDGVLVPVKYLVNGTTVAQVKVDAVVYHHVELSRHAVLLAEGLAAESFLGVRDGFVDAGVPVTLYPDFSSRLWEAAACAPLVVTGVQVAAMRARLARRARRIRRDPGDGTGEVPERQRRG